MEARAAARPEAPPDCPLYPRLLTFRLAGFRVDRSPRLIKSTIENLAI
jgi:hypothetical protein